MCDSSCVKCIILPFCLLFSLLFFIRILCSYRRRNNKRSIAFFHPYCNAGGGGERVLWCALRTLQKRLDSSYDFIVYTGDKDASSDEILLKVKQRFNIILDPKRVHFVFLKCRRIVEADLYPAFTLICQSFAGFLLGCEALWRFCPNVFIDSMGYPFTLPLFRYIAGCRVSCYVHYPVISTDMLGLVASRQQAYNNPSFISRSPMLSYLKLIYYKLFAKLYGWTGRASELTMVNGTWTRNHIRQIWGCEPMIVYPPCDVDSFSDLEFKSEHLFEREIRILSVGQFRPEKNHRLQIEAFSQFCQLMKGNGKERQMFLVLAGSCRHEEDKKRVESLKNYTEQLGIKDNVLWRLNVSFDELLEELSCALIGLHTMWNEHFGIGVVEGMAAGNIMIAHESGGPKLDIVQPLQDGLTVGYLASTAEMYAEKMIEIVDLSLEQRNKIRSAARTRVQEFSDEQFSDNLFELVSNVLIY